MESMERIKKIIVDRLGVDENMLKISNYGILVGNTSIRLKRKLSKFSNIYLTKSYYAKGVIEGLKFYSIIK